jgi:hypothetical protein
MPNQRGERVAGPTHWVKVKSCRAVEIIKIPRISNRFIFPPDPRSRARTGSIGSTGCDEPADAPSHLHAHGQHGDLQLSILNETRLDCAIEHEKDLEEQELAGAAYELAPLVAHNGTTRITGRLPACLVREIRPPQLF